MHREAVKGYLGVKYLDKVLQLSMISEVNPSNMAAEQGSGSTANQGTHLESPETAPVVLAPQQQQQQQASASVGAASSSGLYCIVCVCGTQGCRVRSIVIVAGRR